VKPCRECRHQVSEQAFSCPECGAPYPSRESFDGWGYEYRSKIAVAGLPLIHVSLKYRPNGIPVPACGVIAIGQFACGIFCIGQFSVGAVSLSQFTIAGLAVAQFSVAYALLGQFGLYLGKGYGQFVVSLWKLLGVL